MKEYSRTKNSSLNMVTGLTAQFAMTILRFVSRTVFINVLGAEYLGIGGLFLNILSLLSLSELGLGSAIVYQLYKPLAQNDEKRVRILLKFYKQAYIVIGVTILLMGLLLIPALPFFIKDYDSLAGLGINAAIVFVLYLLQSVSSYLFFAYRTVIIKTAQKLYVLNVVDFFINLATVLLQIAVLLLLRDFMIYIATVIFMTLVKNAVNAVIAQRMFPYAFKKEEESLSRSEVWGIVKDCGALFVFKISGVVLKATDNLVLSKFIGLAIVGIYSNYLLLYGTCHTFIKHFYRSIRHSMGNLYATESMKSSYFMFEAVNFMTILLNGTACVGIAVCTNELIGLWIGDKYVVPQPFPTLVGIELLFSGLKINLGQMRNISGTFRQAWFRPALGAIINVIASILLCLWIGICGVILGTIIADILTNFMIDPRIIHKYSFKGYKPVSYYYRKNITFMLILAVVGVADYLLCGILVTGIGLVDLLLHVIVCLVSVPAVFILVYRNTDVCKYLVKKAEPVVKKIVINK